MGLILSFGFNEYIERERIGSNIVPFRCFSLTLFCFSKIQTQRNTDQFDEEILGCIFSVFLLKEKNFLYQRVNFILLIKLYLADFNFLFSWFELRPI